MTSPLITTILTSHTRPDSLEHAIKSVQEQSFEAWQLIIADDTPEGITRDRIKCICEEVAGDKRISFIQNLAMDNKKVNGHAVQINNALKLARGKYITYLCDSDIYSKNHYDACLKTFDKFKNADIVYSGILIQNSAGKEKTCFAEVIKKCGFFTIDPVTAMYKKIVLDAVGPWDESVQRLKYGDAELWLRIAEAGHLIYPTQDITCARMVQGDSLLLYGGSDSE